MATKAAKKQEAANITEFTTAAKKPAVAEKKTTVEKKAVAVKKATAATKATGAKAATMAAKAADTKAATAAEKKPAAAKKPAVKTAAKKAAPEKVSLTLNIKAPEGFDGKEIFICGNTKALGGWDAAKAVKIPLKNGVFSKTFTLVKGATIEFKLLAYTSWQMVEKGTWYEEIANHVITADETREIEINVPHFNTVI